MSALRITIAYENEIITLIDQLVVDTIAHDWWPRTSGYCLDVYDPAGTRLDRRFVPNAIATYVEISPPQGPRQRIPRSEITGMFSVLLPWSSSASEVRLMHIGADAMAMTRGLSVPVTEREIARFVIA